MRTDKFIRSRVHMRLADFDTGKHLDFAGKRLLCRPDIAQAGLHIAVFGRAARAEIIPVVGNANNVQPRTHTGAHLVLYGLGAGGIY